MNRKLKTGFLILLLGYTMTVVAQSVDEGKAIFMSRCAGCHQVNKVLTGPALAGIDQRRSMSWIIDFVHSSRAMISKGDKDAVAVYDQYNHTAMPDHPDLDASHISSVVAYIRSATDTTTASAAPFARPGKLITAYRPLSGNGLWLIAVYVVVVMALIGALLTAVHTRSSRKI